MKVSKILTGMLVATSLYACSPKSAQLEDTVTGTDVSVPFSMDEKSLVRNPMMGWVLYDDACGEVSKADQYWSNMNSVANKYGSIFYWRSRWSELEPEEGVYAWKYDENFKAIIQGALDRGLKLAFRVYVDSQDNAHQATPDYVRKAGAQGYINTHWTPYVDDPVFQKKFEIFIRAFAQEFDDPSRVDFIDAYNLGWWGEGHHVQYLNANNKNLVFKWITELYGNAFSNVILVTNFGTEIGFDIEKEFAINRQGYIIRRDSMGSTWFRQSDINTVLSVFPEVPFIAECCYWGGASDDYQPWNEDPLYGNTFKTWVDFYNQAYKDAIAARANALDLRQAVESRGWTRRARDLVDAFVVNGGYRLFPSRIRYPHTIERGKEFLISHQWENGGVGVCPNNNRRWNYKYNVAFALLDAEGNVVKQCLAEKAEPSTWLKGHVGSYDTSVSFDAARGQYKLATAIVDRTKNDSPGLNLAVQKGNIHQGWLIIGDITIL